MITKLVLKVSLVKKASFFILVSLLSACTKQNIDNLDTVTTKVEHSPTTKEDIESLSKNHGIVDNFSVITFTKEENLIAKKHAEKSDWVWDLPKVFPLPRVPNDNPMSKAKVELGRFLFYDKRLSANGKMSCGSCHIQSLAFTDGKAQSIGATGDIHPRSSLSLANVAYLPTLNWANNAVTQLESQMLTPLFGEHPIEMGLTDATFNIAQKQMSEDERYKNMFAKAFNRDFSSPDDFGLAEVSQAISSFERSLISVNSKYDQYIEGKAELTMSEIRGKSLFYGERAECHHCHGSFTFNDQVVHANSRMVPKRFHNTGLYNLDAEGSYAENNEGLYDMTADVLDKGKFRAPSLRNIAVTAPYNHDGSTKTLEDVVANYVAGGRIIRSPNPNAGDGRFNPNKSDLVVRIHLTEDEQKDLVAFLRTLTDEEFLTNPNHSDPFEN